MASSSATPIAAAGSQPATEQTSQQTSTTPQTEQKTQDTTTVPAPASTEAPTTAPAQPTQPKQPVDDDDDESDFDELDEVLDDFKPKAPADTPAAQPHTTAAPSSEDFDESAFMNQLEQDMARMMGQAAQQGGVEDPAGFEDTINQGADAFTKQLEESGIAPGDFIKQLLADVMAEGDEKGQGPSASASGPAAGAAAGGAPGTGDENATPESFNDAIQATINRMKESGDKATAAAEEDNTDDLIAQLLKAMEAGGGDGSGGDEGDLSKIFMGMMEQLSNKDMLYEPMKELDTKFGPWISENRGKGKVSDADMERYEKQAALVSEIVRKFEEPGYTDEDPKCREYVWEKMQAMQAAGNPPDELVTNPWMDDMKGGGMPDCPQQ